MKSIFLILFLSIGNALFSQKNIYLNYSIENKNERFPYSFQNEEDKKYISFGWYEDMGHVYGHHYSFIEKNMEDGAYQIFINGILAQKTSFKNQKRHGYTAYYDRKGRLYREENYNEGMKNGVYRTFDENGNLEVFAEYENDDFHLMTYYYPKGEVKKRIFKVPNSTDSYNESYDENGRVSRTSQGYFPYTRKKQLEQNFKDGRPHGEQRYFFLKYTYIVEYDNGKLLKYTLKDDNWEVIKEKIF